MREAYWYLPDGRSLHVICEQHPFGGVTYLYENLTKEYQLESRYNELFNVQRETLDNLSMAVALFGSDARLEIVQSGLPAPVGHSRHSHRATACMLTS